MIYIVYELIFYGAVVALFDRGATLRGLLPVAAICFVYRMALGAVFSFTIAAIYSMNVGISLRLGLFEYMPVILTYIVVTPFILKPVLKQFRLRKENELVPKQPFVTDGQISEDRMSTAELQTHSPSVPQSNEFQKPDVYTEPEIQMDTQPEMPLSSINGFERATRYIGEDASVQLVAVIDDEGLMLGHFYRGDVDLDDWAPFPFLLRNANKDVFARAVSGDPEKIRVDLADMRITVAFEESFNLLVVSERQAEEFINIRINQGLEIIRKYITERYSRNMFDKPERTYV